MAIKTNLGDLKTLASSSERFKQSVPLVSHGYSAPDIFKDGKITVFPWGLSINEWLVSAQGSGNSQGIELTRRLVAKLTGLSPDQASKLPVSEVGLVLMVGRALIYPENRIRYTAVCPFCKTKQKEASVIVPDQLGEIAEKSADYPGYDVITLPACGDVLNVRPLLIEDALRIEERSDLDKQRISSRLAEIMFSIVSINDTQADTKEELVSYVRALHPGDVEYLATKMQELSPGLDDEVKHRCDNPRCEREFSHSLDLNIEFFRR